MSETGYYKIFSRLAKKCFVTSKNDYLHRMGIVTKGKELAAHTTFQYQVLEPRIKSLQRELGQLGRFKNEIREQCELDKRLNFAIQFDKTFHVLELENSSKTLGLLAELEGLYSMYDFLNLESLKYNTPTRVAKTLQNPTSHIEKMEWLGTQKELAELFVELYSKGWISELSANSIQRTFTKSETIHQVLKPDQDKQTYKNQYSQIFTPKYVKVFSGIKKNNRSKK
jgi:hypothetical protein